MPKTGLAAEEIRERALAAAEREICRHGADRLRLSDVARALGLSHAALYKYFADREAILDAISVRWLDGIDQKLAQIAGKDSSPAARIQAWFLALHEMKRERIVSAPELYAAFDRSATAMRPFIAAHLRTSMALLQDLVAEAMDAGEIRRASPTAIARMLFEATVAFHHPQLVQANLNEDRRPALRRLIKTLLGGLR